MILELICLGYKEYLQLPYLTLGNQVVNQKPTNVKKEKFEVVEMTWQNEMLMNHFIDTNTRPVKGLEHPIFTVFIEIQAVNVQQLKMVQR